MKQLPSNPKPTVMINQICTYEFSIYSKFKFIPVFQSALTQIHKPRNSSKT
ncbi:uncharacterized protein MELLADRAFT_90761 [Melampsora larici-populina 98AG31]|uniref:Uncharacterized protein n=1 Tax=Melampsora larici-populina (strain 98AG31 / pathotype 3-4-7) TaxID=747676 RepID=F4R7E0_MELLP|nr:uncharacterized protein MELLADRAFT_90761 [Melampsora larici-populina 98AG31]EGG11300.1 hypothetical protein MELLADRAFT_90761 [Melampsora larici-populina 98AG31]